MSQNEREDETDSEIRTLLGNEECLMQYVPLFAQHSIRSDVFCDLTAGDLEEIGITSLGHRIRILRHVQRYNELLSEQTQRDVANGGEPQLSAKMAFCTRVGSKAGLTPETLFRAVEQGSKQAEAQPEASQEADSKHEPKNEQRRESRHEQRHEQRQEQRQEASLESALETEPDTEEDEDQATLTYGAVSKLQKQLQEFEMNLKEDENPQLQCIANLGRRCEAFEVQIKKLSDQVLKFRTEILRLSKEFEPLPNPLGAGASPTTTEHRTEYFVHEPSTNGPTSSTSTLRAAHSRAPEGMTNINIQAANSLSAFTTVVGGNASAPGSGFSMRNPRPRQEPPPQILRMSSAPEIHTMNSRHPPQGSKSTTHSAHPPAGNGNDNDAHKPSRTHISLSSGIDPLHSLKCNESDNTVEVLASMARMYKLHGDISQWRLQLIYGENVRDLFDHEHPLVIYRQMKEAGLKGLAFQAHRVSPSKMPIDGNFI